MKAKKIIAILMILTASFGMVGCGNTKEESSITPKTTDTQNSETIKQEEADSTENNTPIIEKNEENLFKLGKTQSQDMINILKSNGVTVGLSSELNVNFTYSNPETGTTFDTDWKGYQLSGSAEVNDGGKNNYTISYYSTIKENGSSNYEYHIFITYYNNRDFKIDDFKMLKELVQAQFGKDYNMNSLESWVQEHIRSIESGEREKLDTSSTRNTGAYTETIMHGEKNSSPSNEERTLKYIITLRE